MEDFYRQYGPMVMRRCRQMLKDPIEAQDATQEVFLQVVRKPELMQAEYPSSLLYTMATHHCLNRLRTRQRKPETRDEALLDQVAAHEDIENRSFAARMLDRIFGHHPASTRVMAVLHHLDGLTLEEVAKETSLSVSGVRKRLRALQQTLKQWEEQAHGRPQTY
jgi:RNA polymerase sigma-70 factor, ECF subfamily